MDEDDRACVGALGTMPPQGYSWLRPMEDAPSILRAQIDAAVALGHPKAIMPIGTMQRIAFFKILHIGHVAQLELFANFVGTHGG